MPGGIDRSERSVAIPLHRPHLTGWEERYMASAVAALDLAGGGPYGRQCEEWLWGAIGSEAVMLTTSGTGALEVTAMLLDLQPGDEVIVPSFTFPSTANAFASHGARPVFADIDPRTLNLDPASVAASIGPRTRAIVPVHYAGIACPMDEILSLATEDGVVVIEDNAYGLFGSYRGRPLGSIGPLAALSFHASKIVTCGEGGAVLINQRDYIARAEVIGDKGTNRSAFLRGEVERYTWVDTGSSYLLSDVLAGFLLAQLEGSDTIRSRLREVWESYMEHLSDWAREGGAQLPWIPEGCDPAYSLFYLLMPDETARDALQVHLASRGIASAFHYQPLHLSAMGRRFGGDEVCCSVTEDVARRLLRLPFYVDLTAADLEAVVEAIHSFPGTPPRR